MRKIILLEHVSLDGFVAGPHGEMDWIRFDDQLEAYVHTLHQTTDASIYGRLTYKMMESYWPTVLADPTSTGGALNHARWIDSATKIVLSKTLTDVQWKNSVLIRDNVAEAVTKIKQQPGKDIWMVGSISVAQTLMQLDLIDDYWLNVNPVILGSGKPLFANLDHQSKLKLIEARPFGQVVVMRYEAAR